MVSSTFTLAKTLTTKTHETVKTIDNRIATKSLTKGLVKVKGMIS